MGWVTYLLDVRRRHRGWVLVGDDGRWWCDQQPKVSPLACLGLGRRLFPPIIQSNSSFSTEAEADVALVPLNALSSKEDAALEVVDVDDCDSFGNPRVGDNRGGGGCAGNLVVVVEPAHLPLKGEGHMRGG